MSRRIEMVIELVKKHGKIPLLELASLVGLTPRYLHREVLKYIPQVRVINENGVLYVVWVGE